MPNNRPTWETNLLLGSLIFAGLSWIFSPAEDVIIELRTAKWISTGVLVVSGILCFVRRTSISQPSVSGDRASLWLVGGLWLVCIVLGLVVFGVRGILDGVKLSFLLGLTLLLYFLPSIVAARRRKRNAEGIFLVNLVFGWTLIGWLVTFVWACTEPQRSSQEQ